MQPILAIDMGKNKSVFCDYTPGTDQREFGTLPTSPKDFHDLLVARPGRLVVIEVGPLAGWVVDLCITLGVPFKVVNTGSEEWSWKRVKNKSDRDDALKLAKMEAMHMHRYVHVPSPEVRQWRELIHYREQYVGQVTASKNQIRSMLDRRGERWPAGKKGWTEAALAELDKMARPLDECADQELWRGMLHQELAHLRRVNEELAQVQKKLDAMAKASPRVQRLASTPGVGPRTAEIVIAMIDDPKRFATGKQVGCYAGLTPRLRQSGNMDLQGHVSKAGSGVLRKMLVQACWIGQRYNPWMKEVFTSVCRGSKTRRKTAIVATARRLLVRLWAMDRDQTDWKEQSAAPAPAQAAAQAPALQAPAADPDLNGKKLKRKKLKRKEAAVTAMA
jgi:transposase